MKIWRQLSALALLWQARGPVRTGDPARALRVVESKAGLTEDDYADRGRLQRKLSVYLAGLAKMIAAVYVVGLAGVLGMNDRTQDALSVCEIFLEIEPGDFADVDVLRAKIRERSRGLPDWLATPLFLTLIGSLSVLGRDTEAIALLQADLALDLADQGLGKIALVREFELRLEQRLAGLSPDAVASYLALLVPLLDGLGVGADGAAAIEMRLGLRPDDYQSPQCLSARLDPFLRSVVAYQSPVILVMSLATLLAEAGHGDRAIALAEWQADIDVGDYRDPDKLAHKWQSFRQANYPDVCATFWRVWIDLLIDTGRSEDAVALIEVDSGLRLADLSDSERFGAKLADRLRRVRVGTSAAYILTLTWDLARIGYADQAGLIADWYLRGYSNLWEVPDKGDPGVRHLIPLVTHWLELRAAAEQDFAWRLSGQAVTYLRHSLLIENLSLADRREFVGYIDELRGQIRRVGYAWTTRDVASAHDNARILTAQLWDAELSQRALFEEFLLTRTEPVTPGSPPRDAWPYSSDEPADTGPPQFQALTAAEISRVVAEDSRADNLGPAAPAPAVADPATQDWLREAEQIVREGVTSELLAEALGLGTVLVRAGFRPDDGALAWAALHVGDDGHVRVIAADVGRQGDQLRARWASLRHDIGLQLATTATSGPLATVLIEVAGEIMTVFEQARTVDPQDTDWVEAITALLVRLDSDRSQSGFRGRIGSRIGELLGWPDDPDQLEVYADITKTELSKLAEVARFHLERMSTTGVRTELDQVTRAYLAEIADVWPLARLVRFLGQNTDVVFQLEDTLQQVPMAHYPLADGIPLYRLVRSTRVSLSVLVTIMQARVEQRFGPQAHRLLAMSHFEAGDESARHAEWLHYGMRRLARHHPGGQLTCLNAAEKPPASLGGLRAVLDDGPGFQAVTICGHGHDQHDPHSDSMQLGGQSGIWLHDGLWRGTGCDLSSVNFLLLPSCSMGRLRQAGDSDVAGMCAMLALNRARSVLACRWPLFVDHALEFTDQVVASYLALSASPDERARGSLRARAVNAARHRFLDGTDASAAGILNAVAAFELFGLG